MRSECASAQARGPKLLTSTAGIPLLATAKLGLSVQLGLGCVLLSNLNPKPLTPYMCACSKCGHTQ